MDVFIAKNGKTSGPFSPYQIRGKYNRGTLRPEDHIWYEGAPEWMPAEWILAWKDFERPTDEQKRAIYFLGGRLGQGLMFLPAETMIAELASSQGREAELTLWRIRYPRFLELETWYLTIKPDDLVVSGGLPAMDAKLAEIQVRDFALYERITPDELLNMVEHARVRPYGEWRNDPATEKQIAWLESIGEILRPGITKGEASDLIDRASDAQLRRLDFYGVRPQGLVTKQRASEMIDDYIAKHPESEEQYQLWKQENGYPPSLPIGGAVQYPNP